MSFAILGQNGLPANFGRHYLRYGFWRMPPGTLVGIGRQIAQVARCWSYVDYMSAQDCPAAALVG